MQQVVANEDSFNQMDSAVGDGDMGLGATRAAQAVLSTLPSLDTDLSLSTSLVALADLVSDSFAGTSGPLWGVFLSQAASCLQQHYTANSTHNWKQAYLAGVAGVQQVGGA